MIRAPIVLSCVIASSADRTATCMWLSKAFKRCGRFSVIVATPPSICSKTGVSSSLTNKLNCSTWEQVENECRSVGYGRAMRRSRSIYFPSFGRAVEFGCAIERHDHVDFTIGMVVFWSDNTTHLDHVDGKPMRCRTRFYGAAEFDTARLARAKPTFRYPIFAQGRYFIKKWAVSGEFGLKKAGQV